MNYLQRVRFHEAAHAVIALACGAKLLGVIARATGGMVMHVGGNARTDALTAVAGELAERLVGESGQMSEQDEKLLDESGRGREWAMHTSRNILRNRWHEVLALAEALEHREFITGTEAASIIRGAPKIGHRLALLSKRRISISKIGAL